MGLFHSTCIVVSAEIVRQSATLVGSPVSIELEVGGGVVAGAPPAHTPGYATPKLGWPSPKPAPYGSRGSPHVTAMAPPRAGPHRGPPGPVVPVSAVHSAGRRLGADAGPGAPDPAQAFDSVARNVPIAVLNPYSSRWTIKVRWENRCTSSAACTLACACVCVHAACTVHPFLIAHGAESATTVVINTACCDFACRVLEKSTKKHYKVPCGRGVEAASETLAASRG